MSHWQFNLTCWQSCTQRVWKGCSVSCFLSFYIFPIVGNQIILIAIVFSIQRQKPIYFLYPLLVCDIFFTSVPPQDAVLLLKIYYSHFLHNHVYQLFYNFLGCTECFRYTEIAYDCFHSICHYLRCSVIMNHKLCAILALETSFYRYILPILLTNFSLQFFYWSY